MIYSKRVFKAMKEKHIRDLRAAEVRGHAHRQSRPSLGMMGGPPIHSLSKLQVILPLLPCSSNL